MTVDKILKGFNKLVTKLDAHAESETTVAQAKEVKVQALCDEVVAHNVEASKATEVANKIKALIN